MAKKGKPTPLQIAYKREINRLKRGEYRLRKQGYLIDEDYQETLFKQPKRVTKQSLERIQQIKPKKMIEHGIFVDYETGEIRSAKEVQQERKDEANKRRKLTREANKKSRTPGRSSTGVSLASEIEDERKRQQGEVDKYNQQRKRNKKQMKQAPDTEYNVPGITPAKPPDNTEFPSWDNTVISGWKQQVQTVGMYGGVTADQIENRMLQWLDYMESTYGTHRTAVMLEAGSQGGLVLTFEVLYNEEAMATYMTAMTYFMPGFTSQDREEFSDIFETV